MPKYKATISRLTEYEVFFESDDLKTAKEDAEIISKDMNYEDPKETPTSEDVFIKSVVEDN